MTAEEIFQLYDKGVDHHRKHNIYDQTKKNFDFFEGRQWEGLISGNYNPPVENVIKPIVKHKYNTIAMQDIELVFTSEDKNSEEYLKALNKYFARVWEEQKMYSKMWKVNKYSHIAGDCYIFFYDEANCQTIDNTHIYFGNEYEADIQKQPYIIIAERLDVDVIKKRARENGLPEDEIDLIVSDEEIENRNDVMKYEVSDKKCTSLVFIKKKEDGVYFTRCVRNVIYGKETNTKLSIYPIASLVCNERKGHSRGIGEVEPLINNQIEINKTLFRRSECIKQTAYPKLAYQSGSIENINDIAKVGAAIRVKGNSQSVKDIISYFNPSYISNDAKQYTDELIMQTKELNNSGDGATGNIDPTKASGAAIQALTQQANVSATEQMANFKQFGEDIGLILFELFKNYNPDYKVTVDNQEYIIPAEVIKNIKIKIDVTQATPYSKYAVESELKGLFTSGIISFEEFVSSLDENSILPKNKLQKIIDTRKIQQENQKDMIIKKLQEIVAGYEAKGITQNEKQLINNLNGGI